MSIFARGMRAFARFERRGARKIKEMPVPYRADHVGSLLRPAELLEARQTSPANQERIARLIDHGGGLRKNSV